MCTHAEREINLQWAAHLEFSRAPCVKKWEFRVKSSFSTVFWLKFCADYENRCCQSQFCRQLPVSPPYWKMAAKFITDTITHKPFIIGHIFVLLTNINMYPRNTYTKLHVSVTSYSDVIAILIDFNSSLVMTSPHFHRTWRL